MEAISVFKQGLRGERNQYYPYMLSARQEHNSGTILKHVFGMTRLGIEPTTSRLRGERYTTGPTLPSYSFCVFYCFCLLVLRCFVLLYHGALTHDLVCFL